MAECKPLPDLIPADWPAKILARAFCREEHRP
jgi:hypothetical protein